MISTSGTVTPLWLTPSGFSWATKSGSVIRNTTERDLSLYSPLARPVPLRFIQFMIKVLISFGQSRRPVKTLVTCATLLMVAASNPMSKECRWNEFRGGTCRRVGQLGWWSLFLCCSVLCWWSFCLVFFPSLILCLVLSLRCSFSRFCLDTVVHIHICTTVGLGLSCLAATH